MILGDWSSDVCSSDLEGNLNIRHRQWRRTKHVRNPNTRDRSSNTRVDDLTQRLLTECQRITAGYGQALANRADTPSSHPWSARLRRCVWSKARGKQPEHDEARAPRPQIDKIIAVQFQSPFPHETLLWSLCSRPTISGKQHSNCRSRLTACVCPFPETGCKTADAPREGNIQHTPFRR